MVVLERNHLERSMESDTPKDRSYLPMAFGDVLFLVTRPRDLVIGVFHRLA